MNAGLAGLVSAAIGVALSPISIVEMILILFSRRRTVNTIVFVVMLLLLTGVGVLAGALGGTATGGDDSGPSTGGAVVLVVLGGLLLAIALTNWRNRADTSAPKVLSAIEGMGPVAVALLAPGASLANPKNLVLLIAAGAAIAELYDGTGALLAGVIWVLVATLPYTVVSGYALLGGAAAAARLDTAKNWLIGHNRLLMAVICGLLGLVLLVRGAGALA